MSNDTAELLDLVLDVVGAEASTYGAWQRLAEGGFTGVSLPEHLGGSGGTLADAAAVLLATARAGVSLPLLETTWIVGWLATSAEVRAPSEPVTWAVAGDTLAARRRGDSWDLSGTLPSVPWRHAASSVYVVLPEAAQVAVLRLGAADLASVGPGVPIGSLTVDATVGPEDVFGLHGKVADTLAELALRRALGRSLQIAGGCAAVLDIALRYARERVQFGRPLGGHQVIQHYLARVAAQSYAVDQAATAALSAFESDGIGAAAAVHAAKAVAADSVGEVTTLVHQVVGAIGTTKEHPLHRFTMALWDWREDSGSEFSHAEALAEAALTDDAGLWAFLAPVPEEVR